MLYLRSAALALSLVALPASADIYVHAPAGMNNRNRERKDNRNNANRMFDSQNNGAGGYAWRGDPKLRTADPLTYYTGSKLRVEWTAQHACGANPNIHCELVIQYACDDTLPGVRDGYPQSETCWNSQNANNQGNAGNVDCASTSTFVARRFQFNTNEGTNTIPRGRSAAFYNGETAEGLEYGMHENNTFYETCRTTSRNKRLYTSDQNLQGNTAIYTRQNPNGGRRGLECPEERDYYPYWRPQPWRDVAVLVSNTTFCDYYTTHSQNTVESYYCDCANSASPNNPCPITEEGCVQRGRQWKTRAPLGGGAPDCLYHPFSRDNHLGNTFQVDENGEIPEEAQPETAFYDWEVPQEAAGKECVVRVRYNMSTYDYDSHSFAEPNTVAVGYDSSYNCPYVTSASDCADGNPDCASSTTGVTPACYSALTSSAVPLQNRPYVNLFEENVDEGQGFELGLAINTHQTGRTFQDRTYTFRVENPPSEAQGSTIYNLGLRGRRGNIVQNYPAVEYDFTPSLLEVTQDDYVHIQFHGSDFNAAKNANNGEGWQYSDRTNMVQVSDRHMNYPMYHTQMNLFDPETAQTFAYGGQSTEGCLDIQNFDDNNEQNNIDNCGKLNRMANRFPADPAAGLMSMNKPTGEYYYMSTRNNNFSNRSQKGQIKVFPGSEEKTGLSDAEIIGITFGVLFGVSGLGLGIFAYAKSQGKWCFAGKGGGQGFTEVKSPGASRSAI